MVECSGGEEGAVCVAGDEGCWEGEDGRGRGGGGVAGWGVVGPFLGLGVVVGAVVGLSELGEPVGEECSC